MEINNQLIIGRLSQRMDLDRVYLVRYEFLGQEYHHLILALKPVSGLSHKILKPIVELCLMDQEKISFELIFTPELKNKIKIGSLFYCYAVLPKHEIFSSGGNNTVISKQKEIRGILDLSEKHYEKVLAASAEFLQGAQTFADTANYLRALFMVHQSLESHLKLLQVMVAGKGNNVHSLDSRIRNLDTHFAMFKTAFIGQEEEEKERFKLLDSSFNAVNQNKDLEISAVVASQLYDHCIAMQTAIEKLFRYFMKELQTEYEKNAAKEAENRAALANANQAKEKALALTESAFHAFPWPEHYQSDIQQLLQQVRQDNQPEQIMLLNYYLNNVNGKGLFDFPKKESTTAMIYLVVIKKKVGLCHFRKIVQGKITAIVAFLSTAFIELKLNKGSRFSHTIWNESVVLYRDSSFRPTYAIAPVNWHDTLFKTSIAWARNSMLIQDLLAIFLSKTLSSQQLAVLLLNQLTSIGLHSYLYLRIGYAPMYATTEELIEWTCICDKRVKKFFMPKDELEGILNGELLKQTKGRVDELPPELEELHMEYFELRAKEIADFFTAICEQSVKYMEVKSGIKFNTL